MKEIDINFEDVVESATEVNEEDNSSKEKREKNFKALKSFLKTDLAIKETLLRIAPSPENNFKETIEEKAYKAMWEAKLRMISRKNIEMKNQE